MKTTLRFILGFTALAAFVGLLPFALAETKPAAAKVAPAAAPARSPIGQAQTPAQVRSESPARTSSKPAPRSSSKATPRSATKVSADKTAHAPAKVSDKTASKAPAKPADKLSDKAPAKTASKTPAKSAGKVAGKPATPATPPAGASSRSPRAGASPSSNRPVVAIPAKATKAFPALGLTPGQEDQLLDLLNRGSAKELAALPGIAASRAEAITRARPFASVDEVRHVTGIGSATFERLLAHGKTLASGSTLDGPTRKTKPAAMGNS